MQAKMKSDVKKLVKILGSCFALIFILIIGFAIYQIFFSKQETVITKVEVNTNVVIVLRKDISEQDVLDTFKKASVLGVSDTSYRLILDNEQFQILKDMNIPYSVLPINFPQTRDGFGIYKVEFYPPVYNSKAQSVANYGTLIQENRDFSYLVWANKSKIGQIKNLEVVQGITPFSAFNKVNLELGGTLLKESFNANIKILVISNNIENTKNVIKKYGININDQEEAFVINGNLSTVVLNVNMTTEDMYKLLSDVPQLISIY